MCASRKPGAKCPTSHSCLLYAVPHPVGTFDDEIDAAIRLSTSLALPFCLLSVITEPNLPAAHDGHAWPSEREDLAPSHAERLARAWAELDALGTRFGFPHGSHLDVELTRDFGVAVIQHASRHGSTLIVTASRMLRGDRAPATRSLIERSTTPIVVVTANMLRAVDFG